MHPRSAVFAAWVFIGSVALPAQASSHLSLDEAFARVINLNPELQQFEQRGKALAAERDAAALQPPLVVGAVLENAAGTGNSRGLHEAELTLSLASVLERGSKPQARSTVLARRIDALGTEREARRLDLLAETVRRYLGVAAAERLHGLLVDARRARQRIADAARTLHRAGGAAQATVLAAEAAVARAATEERLAAARIDDARRQLAALWGEREPDITIDSPPLLALPALPGRQDLATLLEDIPDITRFADEARVREAQLALARSAAVPDLSWEFGIRRLQATDDTALVAGISMPFGTRARSRNGIVAAQAELDAIGSERETAARTLYATLVEAHARYGAAAAEVAALGNEVIPLLARASKAAASAYRAGAATYTDWAQIESERAAARREQHQLALDAWLALIEIQRLTGHAFIATPDDQPHGGTEP